MAASRARRRLPISLICAQLRDHIRDLDCSPGRLGAAIDFILETARAGLVFVVEAQDRVDHRDAVVDGNSLQRVRHRPAQIVSMIRFAFKDHADGDNGVAPPLLHRELAHNERNFERARNLEQRGRDAGNQSVQLRNEVIDQPLHIGGVELAGYDWEMSFGGAKNARARGNQIRHGLLILQQARLGKTSIPDLGARLPYVRSLCSARPAVKLAAANASIPNLGARPPCERSLCSARPAVKLAPANASIPHLAARPPCERSLCSARPAVKLAPANASIPDLGARLPYVRSLCSARPAVKLAPANASIPDLGARLPCVRSLCSARPAVKLAAANAVRQRRRAS